LAKCTRRRLHIRELRRGVGKTWVHQHGDGRCITGQPAQEREALLRQCDAVLLRQCDAVKAHACDVAVWAIETTDEADLDWIAAVHED